MDYVLDIDPAVYAAIDVLPVPALTALAEAFGVMKADPWTGVPLDNAQRRDAPVRNMPFGGGGIVTYLILSRDRRIDVLMITWLGGA